MSTKNTIKFEEDKATRQIVHLYAEAFDEDHTYLAFEGFHFEAASSMRLSGEWGTTPYSRNCPTNGHTN